LFTPSFRLNPQLAQNFAPSGTLAAHFGQVIVSLPKWVLLAHAIDREYGSCGRWAMTTKRDGSLIHPYPVSVNGTKVAFRTAQYAEAPLNIANRAAKPLKGNLAGL